MATNTASDSITHDHLLGKTVGGRYVIERLIGRGGVGLVYLTTDTQEQRELVIKVLAPHWAEDGDAVARFDREAQRMAQLDHANVVKMYDHGHFEGRTYIVMEFIRGEPLRRYLDRRKRMSLEEFIPIASQILLGAGYVHERGIMMRDIKPPNIMLCEQRGKSNHVKLLDFGLAKLIEEEEESEITKAHVIGTAAYMSPEQIRGDKIDVRVDVYALGVLFFLMLTGEQPIAGDNDAAVLVNHVHGKPKPLAERLPKGHRIPPELIALIESCLAKDPDDRPEDATAMAEALFEFIPPALFELPDASGKTRAPAENYWSARMHSGPAHLQELERDVSDSAEWTRPLLRRAAQSGQAPLKLAEAEVAAQKAEVQKPIKPRAKSKTGSGMKPRPRSPTGSGLLPRPTPSSGVSSMPRPKPSSPMNRRPGPATIRVTAADAREAVERMSDELDEEVDDLESKKTGRRSTIPPSKFPIPSSGSEISDIVPISMDAEDDVEELEELEEFEEFDEGEDDELPAPRIGGTQQQPTVPSEPMATESLGVLASGGYMPSAAPQNDGMRLGAIVAVAGLFALALGGLTAYLVLGGGPDKDETPTVAVTEPAKGVSADGEAPKEEEPESDVGRVEVRAVEGAHVEIDGEDHGEVPVSVELPLGEHRVKVTAPNHHPWQTTIDVKPGANAAVKAELIEKEADEPPEPSTPTKTDSKRPKSSKPRPKSTKSEPKTKPKKNKTADPFMNSSKGGDDGIFMPVGGK